MSQTSYSTHIKYQIPTHYNIKFFDITTGMTNEMNVPNEHVQSVLVEYCKMVRSEYPIELRYSKHIKDFFTENSLTFADDNDTNVETIHKFLTSASCSAVFDFINKYIAHYQNTVFNPETGKNEPRILNGNIVIIF